MSSNNSNTNPMPSSSGLPPSVAGQKRKANSIQSDGNATSDDPKQTKPEINWGALRRRIMENVTTEQTLHISCDAIDELRDHLELLHSTEYPVMLQTLFPVFGSILKSIPCQPPPPPNLLGPHHNPIHHPEERPEHRIRHTILEICYRLPQNEVLRPYAASLVELAMGVLLNDYEDNAILAVKIIFELHKSYRPMLADHVRPFLDFVKTAYKTLPSNLQKNFQSFAPPPIMASSKSENDSSSSPSGASTTTADKRVMPPPINTIPSANISARLLSHSVVKSSSSFRVLTECPLSVMLLFQLYPKFIKTYLQQLLPLMMDSLAQRPPPHAAALLVPDPQLASPKAHGMTPKASTIHASEPESSGANQETSTSEAQSDPNAATNETGSSPVKEQKQIELDPHARHQELIKALYRKRAKELLAAQVKTLSFVTHLLRSYGDQMKPYEDRLANNVLNLFQMCPREAITARKDLLLGLRHIFATPFRKGFFQHIDTLLDERLLIGKHKQSEHGHLRAAAYSALADLLHYVRTKLTMTQISRVVHLYSRVLHDASMNLSLVTQAASVRLLLNMVDPVFRNKEEKASLGRDILFRILETLVWKIGMLVDHGITEVKAEEGKAKERNIVLKQGYSSEAAREEAIIEFMYEFKCNDGLGTLQNIRDLLKPLLTGTKTLIWCINNYGAQRAKLSSSKEKNSKTKSEPKEPVSKQQMWVEELAVQSLNSSERELLEKYFSWTLTALKVFKVETIDSDESKTEYQDVLENFAASLGVLDSFNFHRVIGSHIDELIVAIIEDDEVMAFPDALLLSSHNVATDFTSCLLRELMKDAESLDIGITESDNEQDQRAADVRMKLFSRILTSLTSHPKNEKVLRPYVQEIIAICLRRALGSEIVHWPGNHFTLLRQLFRGITGGKFEESYKEVLPLLPTLLNGLYRVYCNTNHEILKKVIIEICLTIPARLSSLLPHLSLLLHIIVPALKTNDGDLINLGLRTLEFWVDNLNIDFLFPILSHDEELFADLMTTLSSHLRPAPYQYGLLTLRLLGKLGGKNRLFLEAPMNLPVAESNTQTSIPRINCKWNNDGMEDDVSSSFFSVQLPLQQSCEILRSVARFAYKEDKKSHKVVDLNYIETLKNTINFLEDDYLLNFKEDVLYDISLEQASSAFVVVRTVVSVVFNIEGEMKNGVIISPRETAMNTEENDDENISTKSSSCTKCGDLDMKLLMSSLFFASFIDGIKEDATILLDGVLHHILLVAFLHSDCIIPENDSQALTVTGSENNPTVQDRPSAVQNGKLQPLLSFGRFLFTGALNTGMNYFIVNNFIVEILSLGDKMIDVKAKTLLKDVMEFVSNLSKSPKGDGNMEVDEQNLENDSFVLHFMESLLYQFCQKIISSCWESRRSLYEALDIVLKHAKEEWCRRFEVELLHTAIFCLKDHPDEASLAQKDALVFYFRILILLYMDRSSGGEDVTIEHTFAGNSKCAEESSRSNRPVASILPTSSTIPSLLLIELGSNNSLVRYAARRGLEFLYDSDDPSKELNMKSIISKHGSIIKRHLFSKSLRNLQIPHQIATIETFSYIIKHAPETVPLSDNHVLVLISESLKMMSVADGEMTSESISNNVIVNKDGYCPRSTKNSCMISKFSNLSHSTGILLREAFDLAFGNGYLIRVKAELPIGVQLRVSSLNLFREILKKHSETFLEAESSSSIGNILPHIVSLLFRSLTGKPKEAINAAFQALEEILTKTDKKNADDSQSSVRLPKNLLQMCIKPVLLNLRDYTKLSVPLLRGLSLLLSLLSSWFSKTLGEKLLEHLQKWSDPDKIINQRIWKQGEEPLVAAEIINLFQLLPDEPGNFVEPMIKTTLKLEAVLFRYSSTFKESPYRIPLAKYLNRHGNAVAQFFINDHRFKNPIYSELVQDVVRRKECVELRKVLSSIECSNMLLNVCFETPLAIIRSEKGNSNSRNSSNSRTAVDTLSMHGIDIDISGKKVQYKEDMKKKQDKLQSVKKELTKAEENLRKRMNDTNATDPAQMQRLVNNARDKVNRLKSQISNLEKDIKAIETDFRSKYGSIMKDSKQVDSEKKEDTRSMTLDSLELQYQGFSMIETLMLNDETYITNHHDVVRAFRWLWRSKGRHFRLLHEDALSPRYNGESRYLAKFLVNYSKTAPNDVDVLFDLLRIFLQPTSADFSFVQNHLRQTVCSSISLEQKRRVMKRFFPVIASEGIEELKVLSIQLLVLPMLKYDFENVSVKGNICKEEDAVEMTNEPAEQEKKHNEISGDDQQDCIERILSKDLTNDFVSEVLLKGKWQRSYGSRLTIEVLKLCGLLLDHMKTDLGQHQKTILKFAWDVMKGDDAKAKAWASITISKFIILFDAPAKIILRVYTNLLRSHHAETSDIVRTALDILVPALMDKLSNDHYFSMVKGTIKILFDESDSIPQLSHLWHTVVRHRHTFSRFRDKLMPHLISSLNKLGLPMNSSIENRELSLTLIELALDWDANNFSFDESRENFIQNSNVERCEVFQELDILDSSPSKKMRNDDPDVGFIAISNTFENVRCHYILDQSEINTISNFLVRLVLLVAVADKQQQRLEEKIIPLFKKVLQHWKNFDIRIEYFEKVVSLCMNENISKGDKDDTKDDSKQSSSKNSEDNASINSILLSSCLNIFRLLLLESPNNSFLQQNYVKLGHIIKASLFRLCKDCKSSLSTSLKNFLVSLYSTKSVPDLSCICRSFMEESLFFLSQSKHVARKNDDCLFIDSLLSMLKILRGVAEVEPAIVDSLSTPIIDIALILSKKLSTGKSRSSSKSSYSPACPLESLFSEFEQQSKPSYSMKTSKYQSPASRTKSQSSSNLVVCTIHCLLILSTSSLPFQFSEERRKLLLFISELLESSNDQVVLMAASSVIANWLDPTDSRIPLTMKERIYFLSKLTNVEKTKGFSITDIQPLLYLVSHLVLKSTRFLGVDISSVLDDTSNQNEYGAVSIVKYVSSLALMSTNRTLKESFSKRLLKLDQGILKPETTLSTVFRGDLQGLGNHIWEFVVVDILLQSMESLGSVSGSSSDNNPSLTPVRLSLDSSGVSITEVYKKFLNALDKCKATEKTELYHAIRKLSSCDLGLCKSLFTTLLQNAWTRVQNDDVKFTLVQDFEVFLNRAYHSQFLKVSQSKSKEGLFTNSVKVFLQGLLKLNPLPMINIDLLVCIARNYNCWHEVRCILESQLVALNDIEDATWDVYKETLASSIRRCYLELGEQDTWLALRSSKCSLPGLQYAVSVDMYGDVNEALKTYNHLIDVCGMDESEQIHEVTEDEMAMIEDRWLTLQKETCQWEILKDFTKDNGYGKLQFECAWKSQDWGKLRSLCSSPTATSCIELGDIDVKMSEIFLAIYDEKLNEVENLHAQTAQLCLYKWQLLPSLFSGCNTHIELLRNFNRLVDIRESGQIMVEASKHTKGKTYPDLKNLLTSWKNRLPNDHEPLSIWDDIFQWRSHMFTAVTKKFQWAEQSTLASLHDRPWTAIRMSRAARQLGIPEVSLLSLSKLTDCAMDVSDAFSKLNEQILSYKNGSEDEKKGGLNLINTTNLSYFNRVQKSELFRLKADFLESLGGKTKATQAYCHAIQLCPSYARAWISWGGLCSSLADLVEAQSRRRQPSANPAEDKEKKHADAKKVCQYLAQSMGCYLEAVNCDSSEESRIHLPRCLMMLAKDGSSPGLLCSTFEKYATALPSWVWLPWIPQLLSSLCRIESKTSKTLLQSILTTYPQSAYFSLRSFYLEKRDQERAKSGSSDNNSSSSVTCAEELMSSLRKSQPTLWVSLESILEELIIRFRPSYEEELLATITALLQRADSQLEQRSRGKDADDEAIRTSFSKTLSRVSDKFFRSQSDADGGPIDERTRKTIEFTHRYKESFESDFSMIESDQKGHLSLDEIVLKLNKWKRKLEARVSSTPPYLSLLQVSPSLSSFSSSSPDLWAGACNPPDSLKSNLSKKAASENEKDSSPSSSAAAALRAATTAASAVMAAMTYECGGGTHGNGWCSVEIPGQYAPNICSDEKPNPELHAKLIKFESTVELSRRNDQLLRRIGMVGSDGRSYQFLLQFAIPYWTRTDERTSQVLLLLNKCFRKEAVSSRRNLWLRPTAVIPVAQRLRMTAEDKNHISLHDIYTVACEASGTDSSAASNSFHEKINKLGTPKEGDTSNEEARSARVDAFKEICESVPDSILSDYIDQIHNDPEKYFKFQRTFAAQTALNSLLQYAFCVSERTPSKFIFNKRNGHVLCPDFRMSYSNQGFIDEKKEVPFRLTRTLEKFIGPFLMKGVFVPSMASAATAISKHEKDLEQTLQLLCRDDIVSWYLSKSSQREGSRSTQDLERQLADRVKKNVYYIQSRIAQCKISTKQKEGEKQLSSCDQEVKKLVEIATSAEKIAAMPLNYEGWL